MKEWATTERQAVEVRLADGATLHGTVHLQPRVAHRDGPETVLELLNRDEQFFVLSLPDGCVTFVSKAQTAIVSCEPAQADQETAMRIVTLEVVLHGGEEHHGHAIFDLPPKARSLDFMNSPGRFFMLCTDQANRYLNRSYVRIVRPLD